MVQGQRASDIEERFARALESDRRVEGYIFQPSFIEGRNMPGEIRPDFLVYTMFRWPVQIDGDYFHKTAAQRAEDKEKDARLNEFLRGSGYMPVERVPGSELQTMEQAKETVRRMF
jgi:hypothetical protein